MVTAKRAPVRRSRKAAAPVDDGTVLAAVKRDLVVLAKRLPGVDSSSEGRAVERLAAELDAGFDAPLSAKVSAAREIREALAALRAVAPEEQAADRLDELAARRGRRVAS